MKTDWSLTRQCLESFLSWLSSDREEAGRKFEDLRKKLIRFFTWGGCHIPDELFDRTIEVACKKIESGAVDRSVDPGAYCNGVARRILYEYWREPVPDPLPDPLPPRPGPDWDERELKCLDRCLDELNMHDRNLLLRYHTYEPGEKIATRKRIAAEEGGSNYLRIKVCRLMKGVRTCVDKCLQQDTGEWMQ